MLKFNSKSTYFPNPASNLFIISVTVSTDSVIRIESVFINTYISTGFLSLSYKTLASLFSITMSLNY